MSTSLELSTSGGRLRFSWVSQVSESGSIRSTITLSLAVLFAPLLQDILAASLFYLTHDRHRNLIPVVFTVTGSTPFHGILTPSLNAAAAALKRLGGKTAPEGFWGDHLPDTFTFWRSDDDAQPRTERVSPAWAYIPTPAQPLDKRKPTFL